MTAKKRPGEQLSFSDALRKVRELKDWTQSDLAEKIGTYQPRISIWETGLEVPASGMTRKHLEKFFEAHGVSVQW